MGGAAVRKKGKDNPVFMRKVLKGAVDLPEVVCGRLEMCGNSVQLGA
jgi:hypothetical protein